MRTLGERLGSGDARGLEDRYGGGLSLREYRTEGGGES
jgi:hypothetical protein